MEIGSRPGVVEVGGAAPVEDPVEVGVDLGGEEVLDERKDLLGVVVGADVFVAAVAHDCGNVAVEVEEASGAHVDTVWVDGGLVVPVEIRLAEGAEVDRLEAVELAEEVAA